MNGRRVAWRLGLISGSLLATSFFFHLLLYPKIPVAPGEPYGFGDIIDFVLGSLLLCALAVSGIAALVMLVKGPRQNRVSGAYLLAASVVLLAVTVNT